MNLRDPCVMTSLASLPYSCSFVSIRGQMFFLKNRKNSPNEVNPTSENYQDRRTGFASAK